MDTYRDLLDKEEIYSQQAALMAEREHQWSQADFERFSKLLDKITRLREVIRRSPHLHRETASQYVH